MFWLNYSAWRSYQSLESTLCLVRTASAKEAAVVICDMGLSKVDPSSLTAVAVRWTPTAPG